MLSRRFYVCLLLITLALAACGRAPIRREFAGEPVLRVGILEQRDQITFMLNGTFSIFGPDNRYIARGFKGHRWQVKIVELTPASLEYRLWYASTRDRREAFDKANELAAKKIRAEVLELNSNGRRISGGNTGIHNVVVWRVFRSREEAEKHRQELAKRAALEVIAVVKKPAGGSIEIRNDETKKSFRIPSGSRLVTDRFALLEIPVGNGFHWQNTQDQVFRGNLELTIDRHQKLTAINVIPIEDYLRGVVPSEMHPDFPLEALKAQAVAARSEVLANLGKRHLDDDFDICATVHCQVYSGINRENTSSDLAVQATRGLVLKESDKIIDAVYSGVCGGHTENNDNVWEGAAQPHLRGVYDGNGPANLLQGVLQNEQRLRVWIEERPPAFCNLNYPGIPAALAYAKKYFRWQQELRRTDLEKYLRAATGESFGSLKDIVVLARGVSGRVSRIRIVGTLKSFEIAKELNIRRALSETTLYSSCIYIEKKMAAGVTTLPDSFVIRGAGWGHGVGMCQIGAAGMALKNYPFAPILQHYYVGAKIDAAY